MIKYLLTTIFIVFYSMANADNLQNSDFATPAQITGAGGSISQLLNNDKIFVNGLGVQMSTAITSGAMANSGTAFLMNELATPSNPLAGAHKLFFGSDGSLHSINASGSLVTVSTTNIPSFVPNSVIFAGPSGTITGDVVNFSWDDIAQKLSSKNLNVSNLGKGAVVSSASGDFGNSTGPDGYVLASDSSQASGVSWITVSASGLPITSVAVSFDPSIFNTSGSPITFGAGAISGTLINESANFVFAGPTVGVPATPSFRSLVAADIPALPYSSSTLTSAHIFVGNNLNVATDVAMSGEASIDNTGSVVINNAVSTNTPNAIVRRDLNGDFSANVITASINGNATNVTGTVTAAHGGTGLTTLTSNALLLGNGVGTVNFVSPGSNGDCLQVVGGVWVSIACPSSSGGSSTESFVNISSPTQLSITTTVTNYLVDMSAGLYPITLPAVAGRNAPICFKKTDSTGVPISVTAQAGESIDGDAQLYIENQNAVNCIKTNGVTNYVF